MPKDLSNIIIRKKGTAALTRFEKPSLFKKKRLETAINLLTKEIQGHYGVSKEDALRIATTDEAYRELLKTLEKYWTLKMVHDIMPSLQAIVRKKAEAGWTANAKDGMTAIAILTDKAFREGLGETTRLNIGGKNVQINLGFGFKPYKKKELKGRG